MINDAPTYDPTGLSSNCIIIIIIKFHKIFSRVFCEKNKLFKMRLFDLLVLGPVVNSTGELRIQLPGRNGKIYSVKWHSKNATCPTLSIIRSFKKMTFLSCISWCKCFIESTTMTNQESFRDHKASFLLKNVY